MKPGIEAGSVAALKLELVVTVGRACDIRTRASDGRYVHPGRRGCDGALRRENENCDTVLDKYARHTATDHLESVNHAFNYV